MLEFDGTLIILAVSFIIFMFAMQHIFYAPMNEVRSERKKYIDGNNQAAEKNNKKSQELVDKKEKSLIKAKRDSSEYLNKHTSEANKKRSKGVSEAMLTSREIVQSKKENLEQEKIAVKEEVKKEVSSLAAEISKKILGKEIPLVGLSDDVIERALNQ